MGTTNFGSGYQYYLTTYVNGALTVNTALPDLDPSAVNNAGQITGVEVSKYDSFLYSGGTLTTIRNQPNVIEPLARAMNSSGVITGVFLPSGSSPQQSFLFANGQFMPLATPGTYATVGGINDSGVIAGS